MTKPLQVLTGAWLDPTAKEPRGDQGDASQWQRERRQPVSGDAQRRRAPLAL